MNYKSLLLVTVTWALVFQFGCKQTPPPAAPDTRAADEQAIRDSEAAWVKEYAARDADKVFAHYADDASSKLPDMPLITGKEAIRAGEKNQLTDPKFDLDFHPDKVEVSKAGDVAYSQGAFTYTGTDPKTKKVVTENGNYVEVYKKQADGSWKVVEDIASQEAPPTPVKTAK